MMDELFMDTRSEMVIFCVPNWIQDWAVNALQPATTGKEKLIAFENLLKVCKTGCNFLEGLNILNRVIGDSDMAEHRLRLLFLAGKMSERLYRFDAAIGYYCQSLACVIRPEELHSTIWSNLGFCWLYKRAFKTAEQCCRHAIMLDPRSWEAWKNLGVSLENQRLIQEAFIAYFKAVLLSRVGVLPVKHLIRLSQRHPGIVPNVIL